MNPLFPEFLAPGIRGFLGPDDSFLCVMQNVLPGKTNPDSQNFYSKLGTF